MPMYLRPTRLEMLDQMKQWVKYIREDHSERFRFEFFMAHRVLVGPADLPPQQQLTLQNYEFFIEQIDADMREERSQLSPARDPQLVIKTKARKKR